MLNVKGFGNTNSIGKGAKISRPLALVSMSFLMSACSYMGFDSDKTSVYNASDEYTPVERVEAGSSYEGTGSVQVANANNSFLVLAHEMADKGDHSAAIPLYRRAHRIQPDSAAPLVGLGDSLAGIGQYNDAIEAYEMAVSKNGQNTAALKGLGSAYLALNRPTRALPYLQQANRVSPGDVEAMSSLAIALDIQGHRDASLEVYKDGLALDPDNLKLLNNYGLSLALQSRHDEAISVLKQAAQHRDAGASHRQNLAMAYALSGNEIMSARLLSIDSGPELTNENLNYYRMLTAMPADDRFDSVLSQSGNDQTDLTDSANEVFNDDDNDLTKAITVARLMEVPPEPVAVIEEPEPEDDGVPALLGPEGWALQIAAYRTKEELRPGWEQLKKKYFDIIGHLEPRRSEIDFGDRGTYPSGFFYRLNAGPLTSYEEARVACQKIQELGTDCWVRPPEIKEGDVPESESDKRLADQFKYREELPPQPQDGAL
ncbi:tetratricopeptide repeat protein [Pseudemcibacter aquimaris]|uniref:SPOR domain-containing protein n=1 Tax=Pseudemcibacter aquimaris TaxID=2857064 RepID=UPI0020131DD5|nr:SPOR domain-containing protein [Pseudemcibacter aquimaris]MCC3860375.1 tetratricopeptide repeat protein [Pseudemcibacter aquimaris]WDU57701.1 tetratricopeptide repeat protein [Pseudemcibacter aquimaris]